MLPFLEQCTDRDALIRAGKMFGSMKWLLPSRPHPVVGTAEGIPHLLVGSLTKPMDDAVRAAR